MSVLSSVQDYLKKFTGLQSGAPVWVTHLGGSVVEYSIVPLPGQRVVKTYLNDNTEEEFPFAFQSTNSTMDEVARLETLNFYQAFADWLRSQTNKEDLPDMDEGQTPLSIAATGWGCLFQTSESSTGTYQIQCKLTYEQEAEE